MSQINTIDVCLSVTFAFCLFSSTVKDCTLYKFQFDTFYPIVTSHTDMSSYKYWFSSKMDYVDPKAAPRGHRTYSKKTNYMLNLYDFSTTGSIFNLKVSLDRVHQDLKLYF